MAVMRISMNTRNALVSVYSALIDAGGEPGTISFYTGPQPVSADALIRNQTLLAVIEFAVPCARKAEDGSIEFAPSFQALASANARGNNGPMGAMAWILETDSTLESGKAEWARISDGAGHTVLDCDVSAPGEGGMVEINTVDIVKGGPLRLSNFTFSIPAE